MGLTWGDGTACHLSLPVAWAKGRQGTSLWAALAWCSAPTGHRAPGTLVPLPTAVSIHSTASWLRGCLCRSSVCAWFDCLVDPALWVYGLSAPRPPWSGLALSGPAFLACHARSITSGLSTPMLDCPCPSLRHFHKAHIGAPCPPQSRRPRSPSPTVRNRTSCCHPAKSPRPRLITARQGNAQERPWPPRLVASRRRRAARFTLVVRRLVIPSHPARPRRIPGTLRPYCSSASHQRRNTCGR